MRIARTFFFFSLLTVVGCTGIGSRFIYRDEMNSRWKQERLRGVPVTMKVPTHVKISIVEQRYFYTSEAGKQPTEISNCSRVIDYEFIHTSKLFTVDPKRPAAGTSSWEFDLEGQYPKSAKNDVNDLTIQQVSMAIETVAKSGGIGKLFKAPKGKSASESATRGIDKTEEQKYTVFPSIVASRIFAVDDPMLEVHVEEFMNQHVNCGTMQHSVQEVPQELILLPQHWQHHSSAGSAH